MNLSELKTLLARMPDERISFILPTGSRIPLHAHITEVAKADKHFMDCGGTFRTESICRLQLWFSSDTDHRLNTSKLLSILRKSSSLFESDGIAVDVEYEAPFISQFPILSAEREKEGVIFQLGIKRTECLAQDSCLPPSPDEETLAIETSSGCKKSGCCS